MATNNICFLKYIGAIYFVNNDKSFQKYEDAGGGSNESPKKEQFKMMVHGAVHSKFYTQVILVVSKRVTNSYFSEYYLMIYSISIPPFMMSWIILTPVIV